MHYDRELGKGKERWRVITSSHEESSDEQHVLLLEKKLWFENVAVNGNWKQWYNSDEKAGKQKEQW